MSRSPEMQPARRSARPVRVCFAIENMMPAGTELWVARLIARLDRSEVLPSLCLLDGRSEASRQLEPIDCPILRLELGHLRTVRIWKAARRLFRFLRDEQVDILQVHHADPTYLGVPVARAAGIRRIVQTKYDVGYWLRGADLWMHRLMRRAIHVTVANCEACRQAAIAQEWAPAHQVMVVDNGIPLERLTQIPSLQAKDLREEVHVGLLANLRPIKDPENFVRAASRVAGSHPRVQFHLAGDGELRPVLERQIAELGMKRQITLHGHVTDSALFLSRMQIVVLCSKSEGLPHALLEAMAAGRAVVATAVGGNTELIESQREGLLIPAGDPSALAAALLQLLSHPEQAVELAQNARRKVADRYSFQAMTDRFQKFYRSICVEQPAEHGLWGSPVPWDARRDSRTMRPQSPC